MQYLVTFSNCWNFSDAILILDTIHEQIEKREIMSNVITLEILTAIIGDLTSNQQDLIEESIQLIDAFHTPQLDFNEISKTYTM